MLVKYFAWLKNITEIEEEIIEGEESEDQAETDESADSDTDTDDKSEE